MTAPDGASAGTASIARICNYLLGGKDNRAADREIATRVLELCPAAAACAASSRLYLRRAIRQAAQDGITQFLDLGCGFPAPADSPAATDTHVVAGPDAKVAYVDIDELVTVHARALMKGPDVTAFTADLRDVDAVLRECAEARFAFTRPACLILGSVLHFMSPEQAREAVAAYVSRLAPGSRVIITVRCCDDPVLSARLAKVYAPAALHGYGMSEVESLFGGLELACPGVERVTGLREAGEQKAELYMACGTGLVKAGRELRNFPARP